jgi:uncharacterized protein (TIGR02996 family)
MLSPDENALLSACIAAPNDDLPRLVFADYLDEVGDPVWAELIRVQCELSRLFGKEGEVDYEIFQQKEKELLKNPRIRELTASFLHRSADSVKIENVETRKVGDTQASVFFERGLVTVASLTPAEFSSAGDEIIGHMPLRGLELRTDTSDHDTQLTAVTMRKDLGSVKRLKLVPGGNYLQGDIWERTRRIAEANRQTIEVLYARFLPALHSLNISHMPSLPNRNSSINALQNLRDNPQLKEFQFYLDTHEGIAQVITALRQKIGLGLRVASSNGAEGNILMDGICEVREATDIEVLSLRDNNLAEEHLARLTEATCLPKLRILDLIGNIRIGLEAVQQIIDAIDAFPSLEVIKYTGYGLSNKEGRVKTLVSRPHTPMPESVADL